MNYYIFSLINAVSDGDYSFLTANLMYTQSLDLNQTLCVNITILEDEILENNENFVVLISSADSSVITGPQSTVTIINNDGECSNLSISY